MNRTPTAKVDAADARTFRVARDGAPAFLRSKWLWLLVLCTVAAGTYFFFFSAKSDDTPRRSGKSAANAASRPIPVAGEAARTGEISIYLNGLGTVTPLNTVTVKARVDGQLMKVLFREGQVVKAGELLAEIDPRPYQAMLTQAQGQMARDLALLENAKLDLQRYRTLVEQDSIAKQQVDTQAALVRQYEGMVKIDQGQIDNARLQLTYSRITAPIGGRLGLRQVDPGNIVQASDASGLAVITQLQPITVVFPIAQDSLPQVLDKLRTGEKLTVDAYDRSGKTKLAAGTLSSVDNQIDLATGTVKLKAQFSNDENRLFPNQFVNVRMLLAVKHDVTIIPSAAIQRGAQGTFVYVIQADDTVSMRAVELGPIEGESAAVESGVVPGDQVVVDGLDKLREGAKVEQAGKVASPAPEHAAQPKRGGGRRHRDGDTTSPSNN
jgi:membrane fusion protein, multidrug efflux system